MLNPLSNILDYYSINRSAGGKLMETYLDPAIQVNKGLKK
jgi:hypothetical protein